LSIPNFKVKIRDDDAIYPAHGTRLDVPTRSDTGQRMPRAVHPQRNSHFTYREVRLLGSSYHVRRLFFTAACFIALTAHGKSIDVAEWTEQIKLSDGRIVTVWRQAKAHGGGFPSARRGSNVYFELRYEPLGVRWRDEVTQNHIREPISFDIIDGTPVLTLYIGDREGCRNRPPSDYSAQFLKWSNGQWIDVPQAQFPVERVLMNLYTRYWGRTTKEDARGLITWQSKAERDGFYADHPDTVQSYFTRGARTCESNLRN
jgi:hypothetical protein